MHHPTHYLQWVASVFCLGLFALAVATGLDSLGDNPSRIDIATMITVMSTVAFLPVIISIAWRAGAKGLAVFLVVGLGLWLNYTTPATLGRTGEVLAVKAKSETKADERANKYTKNIETELEQARKRLSWAVSDTKKAREKASARCSLSSAASSSDGCKAEEARVVDAQTAEADIQARVDQLIGELKGDHASDQPPDVGDQGSKAYAWAVSGVLSAASSYVPSLKNASVTEEGVRNMRSLTYGLGIDLLVMVLAIFATSPKVSAYLAMATAPAKAKDQDVQALKSETPPAPELAKLPAPEATIEPDEPPPGDRRPLNDDESLADIRREVSERRYHGVVAYQHRWGLKSKSEACKRIQALEAQGIVRTERDGKMKLVTYVRPQLVRTASAA